MNKQLYKLFGLEDPEEYRKQVVLRKVEEYLRGGYTGKEFTDYVTERRREGKTTQLVISAIDHWLNDSKVVIRVPYLVHKVAIQDIIRKYAPAAFNDIEIVLGTKAKHELICRDLDAIVVLDDEPQMFR